MMLVLMVVALLIAGCAAGPHSTEARPAREGSVEYVVDLSDSSRQMVRVTMTLRADADELRVMLPVWRPGRYVVLDLSGGVQEFSACGMDGTALEFSKADKAAWVIRAAGHERVRVSYRLYANSLGDRTRHADDTHAFLSGAAVFMYTESQRSSPAWVRIDAPAHWRIASGLDADASDPSGRTLIAPSYDVLVDSPIEAGELDAFGFDVDGTPHEIAVWNAGAPPAYDRERLIRDFEAIVREQREVFGTLPYQRYVFLIHVSPSAGGGTEHLNSTIMQTSAKAFRDDEAYRGFLALVSHEFFHTWNVKQLRPRGIHPYDYQRENYTDLLWVAEGTTSYYDDLTLARIGRFKPDDYLKMLAGGIAGSRRRVGESVQSLADSSFDAWVKFNKPSPHDANSTVNFYTKGAQASMVLDMMVREATAGRASLDDVMRGLMERFPLSGPGFTTADVIDELNRVTGRDHSEFFARHIAGTEPLPFEDALAVVGLELKPKPHEKPKDADIDSSVKSWLGFEVADQGGIASVKAVDARGPAWEAGLLAGDVIVAINGVRFRPGDLDSLTTRLRAGDSARVAYFRHDVIRELEVVAAEPPPASWTLERVKQPTPEQKTAYESWLKQPWPDAEKKTSEGSDPEAHP